MLDSLLQKQFVATPQFFLGADQKVTHSYKWGAGTVEMIRP